MAGPLDRQPDKLDYAAPTQFKFGIHQLPKVEFFVTSANIPDISLPAGSFSTPFKDIPIPGEKLDYGDLNIGFLVDEYLENYITLHNWITGLGFPTDRTEFRTHRDVTSNTPAGGAAPAADLVGAAVPDKALYSDAYLMVLSNKNNPILQIDFQDVFPTQVSGLSYNQQETDTEYMSCSATFAYKMFTITTL